NPGSPINPSRAIRNSHDAVGRVDSAHRRTKETDMTEAQNTAIMQEMYAAFGRGDIATLLDHCTEDIVWNGVYGCGPQVPFTGERRGKAAVADFFKPGSEKKN